MNEVRLKVEEMCSEIESSFNSNIVVGEKISELMSYASKNHDYYGISKAHLYQGKLDTDYGNVNDGISRYIMALSYTYYEGLEVLRPPILNNLGVAQSLIGNQVAAIEHLSTAKTIILQKNMRLDLIPIINGNIADAYLGIHQPEKALEYLDKVNESLSLPSYEKAHLILSNYAEAYLQLNEPEKTFNYILWFEEIVGTKELADNASYVDYLKAKYFELLKEYKDSDVFYRKSIAKQKSNGYLHSYPKISADYIAFLVSQKKYKQGIPLIRESLKMAEENHWDFAYATYYGQLAECYKGIEAWEKAFEAINLYFDFNNRNKERMNRYQLNLLNAHENLLRLEIKNNMLTQSIENMKVINNILKRINSIHDLTKLVKDLYVELKAIFEIDTFSIGLLQNEERRIHYIGKYENDSFLGSGYIAYDNPKSFSIWVKDHQTPLIIHDSDDFEYIRSHYSGIKVTKEDYMRLGNHSRSIIIWPLMMDDEMIGLINIQSLKSSAYSTYDIELIEMLSSHLAIALANNRKRNELSRLVEKLNELSFIDSLTGIYNRQAFNEYLPSLYQIAIEKKQNLVFAMLDLDNFKLLNDTFGHQEGDNCLQQFGLLLKDVVGDLGYAYRYGGDEFSLLFSGIELEVVDSILEEICQKSRELYVLDHQMVVSASIGAVFIEHGDCEDMSMQSFINYADNALYIAKSEGKNMYRRVIV